MIFDKSVYSIIILLYASLLTPTNEMNGTQIDYFHLFLGSFFWPKCQKKIGLLDWKKNQGFSIETQDLYPLSGLCDAVTLSFYRATTNGIACFIRWCHNEPMRLLTSLHARSFHVENSKNVNIYVNI